MAIEIVVVIALGVAAGTVAGLFGVGGGIIFVPTLTLVLGLDQLGAEATSLLAIIPVAVLGSWRQSRAGTVRWRPTSIASSSASPSAPRATRSSTPRTRRSSSTLAGGRCAIATRARSDSTNRTG